MSSNSMLPRLACKSVIMVAIGMAACKTPGSFHGQSSGDLRKKWEELNLYTRYHVGLSVYDAKASKTIFGYRDDNYFTPASNTKILTLYAALQLLGEHLVAAYYSEHGDSLFIWGGGDPGNGYPNVDSAGALVNFISASNKQVFFSNDHFRTTRFGKGWAWDDYPYSFQPERNAYPIYGNELWVRRDGKKLVTRPAYLEPFIELQPGNKTSLVRKETGESFTFVYDAGKESEIVHVPIAFLKNDIVRTWSEATGKKISMMDRPVVGNSKMVAGSPRDTLLKIMMQESDNFIAEQVLLACAMSKLGYMDEQVIIDDVQHTLLATVDDYIQWVDGSGLSRYNLVTPRSLVDVLQKIYALKGMAYIKTVFPAGGKSGTIKDWYGSERDEPFVFAKSGSLRNQHCLSGYLVTKRGHVLIFSFLHNQFVDEPATIRGAMENLFNFLYDKY